MVFYSSVITACVLSDLLKLEKNAIGKTTVNVSPRYLHGKKVKGERSRSKHVADPVNKLKYGTRTSELFSHNNDQLYRSKIMVDSQN